MESDDGDVLGRVEKVEFGRVEESGSARRTLPAKDAAAFPAMLIRRKRYGKYGTAEDMIGFGVSHVCVPT